MASRSETTRDALIRAAEHLFARRGFDVPVYEIHTQAGQRNASALHYHFGNRDGLTRAVFERHALSDADVRRIKKQLLARSDDPRAVVEAVVERQRAMLATAEDRDWLRIMSHAQLRAPVRRRMVETLWDEARQPLSPSLHALAVATRGHASHLDDALVQERTLTVFTFITSSVSGRAQAIDDGAGASLLDEDMFIVNLVDMAVAALLTPTMTSSRF
jgi:AcrR family transcriptional regulator